MSRHSAFASGYRIGGVIALVLGAAHFLLPGWGYDGLALQSIPEVPRNHFVHLGTYESACFSFAPA